MRAKTLLVSGLLAATIIGCGGTAGNVASPTGASPVVATAAPMSEYVAQLNELCAGLRADLFAVTTPHPGSFTIEDYQAEQPKVTPLIEAFDAKVEAIPVTAADRPAADAFGALQRMSDATEAELAAAAATGKQDLFDATIVERHRTFDASSVVQDLGAAGIICNAR